MSNETSDENGGQDGLERLLKAERKRLEILGELKTIQKMISGLASSPSIHQEVALGQF